MFKRKNKNYIIKLKIKNKKPSKEWKTKKLKHLKQPI